MAADIAVEPLPNAASGPAQSEVEFIRAEPIIDLISRLSMPRCKIL